MAGYCFCFSCFVFVQGRYNYLQRLIVYPTLDIEVNHCALFVWNFVVCQICLEWLGQAAKREQRRLFYEALTILLGPYLGM